METTKIKKISIFFSISFLIIACSFLLSACNESTQILTRNANNNDIYVDTSEEISLNIKYTVIPNVDINGLELTFKYYDTDYNLLTTKVENLRNVKKGVQYTVSVSLFEFGFFELFKINKVSIGVTSGTVSLI